MEQWTVKDSEELYGINNWGAGYFGISKKGDVVITPFPDVEISIPEVIDGLKDRGLDMPLLLRVENILDNQIESLHKSFRKAIKNLGYNGEFRGVYPIKVNQQQQVVEEIASFGAEYHHGLEAGSKPELLTAMTYLNDPESCLICNGYKDKYFIDLGLYAVKMGMRCIFVMEMPNDLDLILERSKVLGIKPMIGIRMKTSTPADGHWGESSGEMGIFGLTTNQIMETVDVLKKENMLDCLCLLHCHVGSQISNIRDIRAAALEASRIYASLVKEGAKMGYMDFGGGLAVDYDGSHSNYSMSRNYTVDEYCADIIETVMAVMNEEDIPHPNVITESGRSTVAYYSVLLFNVLHVNRFEPADVPDSLPEETFESIKNMLYAYKTLTVKNVQECFNDALYYRDEVRQAFIAGDVDLRDRALADRIFWNIMHNIAQLKEKLKKIPPSLSEIEAVTADTYLGNFSVFQSLPDSWAIDQTFPVMPVHRLNEFPDRRGIITDLTCDCDGKLSKFNDLFCTKPSLELHSLNEDEPYYIGVFLVGAYQETLGDLHNLFGDTNIVSIRINEDGTYKIVREVEGDSVGDVLSYVEYNTKDMAEIFRKKAENAIDAGKISPNERKMIMKVYEKVLNGSTYLK